METIIEKISENNINKYIIEKAGKILNKGGLVALPTETVYGLGANALDDDAIKSIYLAKGRPSDNPLIVHISEISDLNKYVKNINNKANKLIDNFWPGPMTLIFEKKPIISDQLTGGLKTVAIRLPANNIAREIIKSSQVPIAAPSANTSGKPSPTVASHVIEDLNGKIDMIIDGGACEIGLESTVIDVSTEIPTILRPGGITKEMIEKIIGQVYIDPALKEVDNSIIPKAPGMKYRHYAPKAQLYVIDGQIENIIKYVNNIIKDNKDKKIGVITTNQTKNMFESKYTLNIGDENNPEQIASNLFKILRMFDEKEVDIIYCQTFSNEKIGYATMNRLLKAAGNKLLNI